MLAIFIRVREHKHRINYALYKSFDVSGISARG